MFLRLHLKIYFYIEKSFVLEVIIYSYNSNNIFIKVNSENQKEKK